MVSGVLVSIGQSLGSTSNIQWVTSAYAVASALSFTIAGSLSDIFGRRYVIITGQAISILGAVSAPVSIIKHALTNSVCRSSARPPRRQTR